MLPVQDSPFIILTWWVYFASDRERGEEQHYGGELMCVRVCVCVCVCAGGGARQIETDDQTRCEGVHVCLYVCVVMWRGMSQGQIYSPFPPS